ncbi:MAG: hypothetical protein ABW003_21405 [Microvirga sp.]
MARLPVVIGLGRIEAAAAIGVSANTFDIMVRAGQMPRPRIIGKRRIWKVDELSAAFDALPREGGDVELDTWADFRCASNT